MYVVDGLEKSMSRLSLAASFDRSQVDHHRTSLELGTVLVRSARVVIGVLVVVGEGEPNRPGAISRQQSITFSRVVLSGSSVPPVTDIRVAPVLPSQLKVSPSSAPVVAGMSSGEADAEVERNVSDVMSSTEAAASIGSAGVEPDDDDDERGSEESSGHGGADDNDEVVSKRRIDRSSESSVMPGSIGMIMDITKPFKLSSDRTIPTDSAMTCLQ